MALDGVRGTGLCGETPRRLALSDGSRLLLDGAADGHRPVWRRVGGRRPEGLSVDDALELAGPGYAEYVEVRTRAEVEWMRAVADWYRAQARALELDLDRTGGA
jgi:hypothetical protein